MRFILVAITMVSLAVSAAAADPLSAFVGIQNLQSLRAGTVLAAGLPRGGSPKLIPSVSSAAAISSEVKQMNPNVGAELLQIIPGDGPPLDSPAGMLALYNVLHAVSTMKGVTYYSVTRRKEMVLFLQSYVIPSPAQSNSPQPDPVFNELPPEHELFTLQEDTSFGRNTYAEHVAALPDHLYLKSENLSTITFLLMPVVTPHNLVSHVVLVPAGKDVLFYGVSCLRSGIPMGDVNSRTQSMENRLIALAGWLKKRMAGITAASMAGG
jgi:hypothetical protein